MVPKKKKRIKTNVEDLEQLGIYTEFEEYDDDVQDEKEAWRDVG